MKKVLLAFIISLLMLSAAPVVAQDVVAVEVAETTVDVKPFKVLRISGRWIWVDIENEGRKRFRVPHEFRFMIDGEPVGLDQIVVGQHLRAYITHTENGWVLVSEPGGVEAVEEAEVVAEVAEVAPEPEPEPVMPDTASQLPLIGLLGLAFLGLGFGLGVARRRL